MQQSRLIIEKSKILFILNSNVSHFINYLSSCDNEFGTIFSAVADIKGNLNIIIDRRAEQDLFNKRFTNNAYDYLNNNNYMPIYKSITQFMNNNNLNSILDIGCWDGMLYNNLKNIKKYCGIDVCSKALESIKRKNNIDTKIVEGSILDLPAKKEKYDIAYFGGILFKTSQDYNDIISILTKYISKYELSFIAIQESYFSFDLQPFVDYLIKSNNTLSLVEDKKIKINIDDMDKVVGDGRNHRFLGVWRRILFISVNK